MNESNIRNSGTGRNMGASQQPNSLHQLASSSLLKNQYISVSGQGGYMISSGASNDNMYSRHKRTSVSPSGINITKSFLFMCQKEDAPMLSAGTGENQGTIMSKS